MWSISSSNSDYQKNIPLWNERSRERNWRTVGNGIQR
jgi:hypothetical protein